jgi:hypothetical protein
MAHFLVRATLNFVNGSQSQPISFSVHAVNEFEARRTVTPDYIMENVSDDWGLPIQSVRVLGISAVKDAGS